MNMMAHVPTEAEELEWVIRIARGLGGDFSTGAGIRRRIAQSVRPHFETDEGGLGQLVRVSDAKEILDLMAEQKTGAEVVPFLDVLLLTVPAKYEVLEFVASRLGALTVLLKSFSLDRQVVVRLLVLARLLDEDWLSSQSDLSALSKEIRVLLNETIDPLVKQNGLETGAFLDGVLAAQKILTPPLSSAELKRLKQEDSLCLACDADHPECSKPPSVCLNCRGERVTCSRGCSKPCRVCNDSHPGLSIVNCLERAVGTHKRKAEIEEDEPEARKLRSVKEYRENKKKAKEEKRHHTEKAAVIPNDNNARFQVFEKVLKDTVAAICFDKLGTRISNDEVPEWRKVYRTISAILIEKESRMPDEFKYRASTSAERAAVVKRVNQFCLDYLKKQDKF